MEKHGSSNVNEVVRSVLNYLLFFMIRFYTYKKAQKRIQGTKGHKKTQKRNQAKAKSANKQTKTKNALKKYLSGKK